MEPDTRKLWVYDGPEQGMVYRDVTFVPGLYKIFDEILVNAADNKQRDRSQDCIKASVSRYRYMCKSIKGQKLGSTLRSETTNGSIVRWRAPLLLHCKLTMCKLQKTITFLFDTEGFFYGSKVIMKMNSAMLALR